MFTLTNFHKIINLDRKIMGLTKKKNNSLALKSNQEIKN